MWSYLLFLLLSFYSVRTEHTITICHFSDIHSVFSSTDHDSGGLSTVHGAIKSFCPENRILTFGGDFLDHTNIELAKLESMMLNDLGVDVYTFGNHEFDKGEDILQAFGAASIFSSTPVISNLAGPIYNELQLSNFALKLAPGGVPICYFGLLPLDTEETAAPSFASVFTPYKYALEKAVLACEIEYLTKMRYEWADDLHEAFRPLCQLTPGTDLKMINNRSMRPLRLLLSHVGLKFDSMYSTWEEPAGINLERAIKTKRKERMLSQLLQTWTLSHTNRTLNTFSAEELDNVLPHELLRLREGVQAAAKSVRLAHEEIKRKMPYMDLILGAHSHTVTPEPFDVPYYLPDGSQLSTAVVHAGHHSMTLGRVVISIKSDHPNSTAMKSAHGNCSAPTNTVRTALDDQLIFNLKGIVEIRDRQVGLLASPSFSPIPTSKLLAKLPVWNVPNDAIPASTDLLVSMRQELKSRIKANEDALKVGERKRLMSQGELPPPFLRDFFSSETNITRAGSEPLGILPFGLRNADVRERSTAISRLVGDSLSEIVGLSVGAAWLRLSTNVMHRSNVAQERMNSVSALSTDSNNYTRNITEYTEEHLKKKINQIEEKSPDTFSFNQTALLTAKSVLKLFSNTIQATHMSVIGLQPAGNVRRPFPRGTVTRHHIAESLPMGDDALPLKWLSIPASRLCDILDRGVEHVVWVPPARAPTGVHRKGAWPILGNVRAFFDVDVKSGSQVRQFEIPSGMNVNLLDSWEDGMCPVDSSLSLLRTFSCNNFETNLRRMTETRFIMVTCDFVANGGDGLLAGVDNRKLPICDFDYEKQSMKMHTSDFISSSSHPNELFNGGKIESVARMDICEIIPPLTVGQIGAQSTLEMYLRWWGGAGVWGSKPLKLPVLEDDDINGKNDGRYNFSLKNEVTKFK